MIMNLSEEVNHIISVNTRDLYFLLRFVEDIEAYIEQRQRAGNLDEILVDVPEDIKPEFIEFWKEFIKLALKSQERPKGKRSFTLKTTKTYSEQVMKYWLPVILRATRPLMYPEYLYDMALTHAIAILEAFLSDFLSAIFTERPETLKSENTASYEEILSFQSMKSLTKHLATTRVKKIMSDNIDDVAEEIQKMFSIDISRGNDFNVIREAFYRRHVVVHNKGIADKKYCEKIPNSQVGVKLSTNYEYLATLFAAIGQLVDYLDKHFSRKMRYKRDPRTNLLLTTP
jgi:hypothetical protein